MPMHQVVSPDRICGRNLSRCSFVPYWMRAGPIWRSPNQLAAIGAPALIISSPTMSRSIGGRPPPPNSFGHVMPIHPSAASSRENSFE